jgi:hypothetical protein
VTPYLTSARNIQGPFCVKRTEFGTHYWNATDRLGSAEFQRQMSCLPPNIYEGEHGDTQILRRAGIKMGGRENILLVRVALLPTVCSETLLDPYTGVADEPVAEEYMQSLMKVSSSWLRL